MNKKVKGFIAGCLVASAVTGTALAGGITQSIDVVLNGINLEVEGAKVDTNNILYQGTTYVPIRKAAEMLGKNVNWDQKTNTTSISNNQPASNKIYDAKESTYILDTQKEDVTGDNVKDEVLLIGKKGNIKDIFSDNIRVIVKDGKTKETVETSIGKYDAGYDGNLFLGDFNKDKIADVLVSVANGGSGGTSSYSILSFKDNKAAVVFDQEKLSRGPQFEANFMDGFKAEVTSKDLDKTIEIDISSAKDTYVEMGIYNEDGKLLKETTGVVNGYSLLNPVDYDRDGNYELEGYQRMWGAYHADTISNVKSLWKFDDAKWNIYRLEVSTLLKK